MRFVIEIFIVPTIFAHFYWIRKRAQALKACGRENYPPYIEKSVFPVTQFLVPKPNDARALPRYQIPDSINSFKA